MHPMRRLLRRVPQRRPEVGFWPDDERAGRLTPGAGRLMPGAGRLMPGAELEAPGTALCAAGD